MNAALHDHRAWRRSARRGRAFTLAEMVVAAAAGAILLAASGSAILIATRAVPTADSSDAAALAAARALDAMFRDLQCAVSIKERASTAVTVIVPDRDGDCIPETIRYAWSRTAGTPLTREYNGSASANAAENVQAFALSYDTEAVKMPIVVSGSVTSPEILLATFGGWSIAGANVAYADVRNDTWVAEAFTVDQVALPPGTTSVAVTRVELMMKKSTGTSPLTIGIHPTILGGALPAANPIGTPFVVSNSDIGVSGKTVTATFGDVSVNGANPSLAIVVKGGSDYSAAVRYLTNTDAPVDSTVAHFTSDSGVIWTPVSNAEHNDVPFWVWGTFTAPASQSGTTVVWELRSVSVVLRTSTNAAQRMQSSVELLNRPQVTSP